MICTAFTKSGRLCDEPVKKSNLCRNHFKSMKIDPIAWETLQTKMKPNFTKKQSLDEISIAYYNFLARPKEVDGSFPEHTIESRGVL